MCPKHMESTSATVHGVMTELSPVKVSRKNASVRYCDCRMTDGKSSVRMVCFEPSLRNALESARKKKEAVSVVGCSVKQARNKEERVEIIASKRSTIVPSPRKYAIPEAAMICNGSVQLSQVEDLSVGHKVSVSVKVNSMSDGETVTTRDGVKIRKQDCIVGDSSASLKLVLWEEDVGCMDKGMSYKVDEAVVKCFDGIEYLSVGKLSAIEKIDDIGEVMEADEEEEENELCLSASTRRGCVVEGEINGVLTCGEYHSCISCKSKVKELNDIIGECSRYKMVMKIAKCSSGSMAKVLIGDKEEPATMFENVIAKIVDGVTGDGLSMKLLCAPGCKYCIDHRGIVYAVQKL